MSKRPFTYDLKAMLPPKHIMAKLGKKNLMKIKRFLYDLVCFEWIWVKGLLKGEASTQNGKYQDIIQIWW